MRLRWLVCAMMWVTVGVGRGADFPDPVLPQGVGVNIHFTSGHERDLDLIAAAGFKFIRMDFTWAGTERQPGQYQWRDYEELLRGLEQRGLSAIFILDYSNELYEKGAAPQHAESVAAFARWAGAAARHFRGHKILWEIWNEPNIGFWKPKPDVRQYIALARATCQAIRAEVPEATIIAPASSEFPWAFFEEMFKAGLLDQLDGVSVHPYRQYHRGPETAADDYLRLRGLIERYAPKGKPTMPILSGEWGYASHSKGVSLETQAAFAVRQQLANLLCGVPLSIWYDWKNDGPDPNEGEHHFGTVFSDLKPKPAYEAIQVMTRQLSGYRVVRRLDVGQPDAYVVLLVNSAGEQQLAVWSAAGDLGASLDTGLARAESIGWIDGKGKPQVVDLQAGQLRLALSALPGYVSFREPSPALSAAAAWQVQGPFPRSVTAGAKEGVKFKLLLRNPFPRPVRTEAELVVAGQRVGKKVKLSPGKSTEVMLAATVSRRDVSRLPVKLTVATLDTAGKLIGRSSEDFQLWVANPLHLTVAPVETGFRVTIQNEGNSSFDGRLKRGEESRPVCVKPMDSTSALQFEARSAGAETVAGPFDLVSTQGKLVAQLPAIQFQPISATQYAAELDGDAKIEATAAIKEVPAPGTNAPYSKAFALDYQFGEGWRFVRCAARSPIRWSKRPSALGVWVYGDNSGNSLRVRIRDAAGQTFQPSGPTLDWAGWRWVVFDLEHLGTAGHWGGADDGVVRGELALDTPLLLDGTRRKTSGQVFFAGLTAIY